MFQRAYVSYLIDSCLEKDQNTVVPMVAMVNFCCAYCYSNKYQRDG